MKTLSPETKKVISDYQQQCKLTSELQTEIDSLSENHKRIEGDLKTLRAKLNESEQTLEAARGDYLRGRSSQDELTAAREAHGELEAAIEEAVKMAETAKSLSIPATRQMDKRNRLLQRFSNSAWDALSAEESKKINLPINVMRGYAAARRGTFPPSTLGSWLDNTLDTVDDESYADAMAKEHNL